MFDLESLSLNELKKLARDVQKAIDTYQERERLAALTELEALAHEKGFTLSELAPLAAKRKAKSGLPPKYFNPENPSQTWSGRGRRPKWLEAALESGKSLEDFKLMA